MSFLSAVEDTPKPDEELKFVKEIDKLNHGFRASRRRTKMSRAAFLIDFLNNSEIPDLGNELLYKSVSDCEEWTRLLDDTEPAQILFSSHDKAKSDDDEEDEDRISNAMVLSHQSDFFDEDEKPIKLWVMAGLHSKPKHNSRTPPFSFPLPLGAGLRRLNSQEDFKLPWNIYCPANGELKVLRWKSLKKNIWKSAQQRSKVVKALKSNNELCDCQGEKCGESCFNRLFQIECDSTNCRIGPDCGNRNFTNLAKKLARNCRYVNGVEVVSAGSKGNGLRSIRSYSPHSLIVEYTGEIIDQEEVERRLNEEYGGYKHHYYFLSLGQGLSIDGGSKGSVARFANHSCEPNAEMQKWIVNGEPRIGLFAGPEGISPGSEITYHYNFEWFPDADPQPCYCGAANCSGFIGRRTDSASSKQSSPSSPTPKQDSPQKKLVKYHKRPEQLALPPIPPKETAKLKKTIKPKIEETDNPYEKRVVAPSRSRRHRHSDEISYLDITAALPLHMQRQLSINMAPPGTAVDEVSIGMAQLAANAAIIHNSEKARPVTRHLENELAIDAGIPMKFLKAATSPSEEQSSPNRKKKISASKVKKEPELKRIKFITKKSTPSNPAISKSSSSTKSLSNNFLSPKKTTSKSESKSKSKSKSKKNNPVSTPTSISSTPKQKMLMMREETHSPEVPSDSGSEESSDSSDYSRPNKLLSTRQLDNSELMLGSQRYIKALKNLAIDDEVPAILERTSRRSSSQLATPRSLTRIQERSYVEETSSWQSRPRETTPRKVSSKKVSPRNIITPEFKQESALKEDSEINKIIRLNSRVAKQLADLMIDDKIPTVFERSPRSIVTSSAQYRQRQMNMSRVLPTAPPPPPPATTALDHEAYESLPSVQRRRLFQQNKLANSPIPAISQVDYLGMPRIKKMGTGSQLLTRNNDAFSLRATKEAESDNDLDIDMPQWLPAISSSNTKSNLKSNSKSNTKRGHNNYFMNYKSPNSKGKNNNSHDYHREQNEKSYRLRRQTQDVEHIFSPGPTRMVPPVHTTPSYTLTEIRPVRKNEWHDNNTSSERNMSAGVQFVPTITVDPRKRRKMMIDKDANVITTSPSIQPERATIAMHSTVFDSTDLSNGTSVSTKTSPSSTAPSSVDQSTPTTVNSQHLTITKESPKRRIEDHKEQKKKRRFTDTPAVVV